MNFLKNKVGFGIDIRKKLNGSDLYVKTFQIASMIPVIYMFVASGSLKLFSTGGPLAWIFDLGMSMLPRVEVMGLSYLYRSTSNEIIMLFTMLAIGLVLGLLSNIIFREDEKRGIAARKLFMALIGIDLVIRLIPVRPNLVFGPVFAVIGLLVRAACIAALYMDIRAEKQKI